MLDELAQKNTPSKLMQKINQILAAISRRAERTKKVEHLVNSFVDVGSLQSMISNYENQVIYGRKGTGKTHALIYLNTKNNINGRVSINIDLRTIGSSQSFYINNEYTEKDRALRLLSDILGNVHEAILETVSESDEIDLSAVVPILDEFVECITNIEICGTIERESQSESNHSNKLQYNLTASSSKGLTASLSETTGSSEKASAKQTRAGYENLRIHFGLLIKSVKKLVKLMPENELWILLDEWGSIPYELQPYVADLLRKVLFPVNGVIVKIATTPMRANFRKTTETQSFIGFELGVDVSSVIDLDEFLVFENNYETAKSFFKNLIHKHALAIDTNNICSLDETKFINHIFTQRSSFEEFVRASEGSPRDAINILSKAAFKAADSKIAIKHIREAARSFYHTDKHNELNSNAEALELLDWIIREVISTRKTRGFLLSCDSKDKLIDYLYDARVLHILKQGVSVSTMAGKRFNIYSLDYGCYVDLIGTQGYPKALLIASSKNNEDTYVEIPAACFASAKHSILELQSYYNQHQTSFSFVNSAKDLTLAVINLNSKKELESSVPDSLLDGIPKNIENKKIDNSIFKPLIFVALIIRKAQNHEYSTGVQITNIINEYLIHESKPKKPNNISRELRDQGKIEKMPWLTLMSKTAGSGNVFCINELWKVYWKEYFDSPPPNIM
ncbi:hypothetical protein L0668_08075 [Paraglaciecola aquimarina]|uniref:Uncharacterized protein n=1 Tax=Paraglaciecola algarum TaxID=3050085 RepID=A0ABS9D569_9ALTE|nr:hypothetical protein [Paraglaciecola sp. G1-23]MCF2948059.1 hypothetical protein [Paraglaciecola sp. G1-23]